MKTLIRFHVLLIITSWICMSEVCAQQRLMSALKGVRDIDWYSDVWLPDTNIGIVVGMEYSEDWTNNKSLILRTEDGGDIWNLQTHPTILNGANSPLYEVCFSDPMNGWACGQLSTVLNTKDGGKTWKQRLGPSGAVFSVFCTDSLTAWAGVFGPNYYHTTDGGKTWAQQKNELKNLPWDIFFLNADTGIAVGGWCANCKWSDEHEEHSFILRTTNGGDTWILQEEDTNTIGYQTVFFANDTIGYVAGTEGTIKRTNDGGLTWTKQTSGTTTELFGMYFLNSDTGFVVGGNGANGYEGKMLHTTDGGTTWTEQDIITNTALYAVYFADENTGVAVGDWGTILSTTSGGESWTLYTWPPVNSIISNEILTGHNYPNPFSGSTTIRYEVSEAGYVTLKIYSLDGKIIVTLVDDEMWPGIYEVTWDAGDLPAGIYFCRFEAGSSTVSRKLLLQK